MSADGFYEGPDWRRDASPRAVVVGPGWLDWAQVRLGDRMYPTSREARIIGLARILGEAAERLGLPGEVRETALRILSAVGDSRARRPEALVAVAVRIAAVLHGWPLFMREVMEALGVGERDVYRAYYHVSRAARGLGLRVTREARARYACLLADRLSKELGLDPVASKLACMIARAMCWCTDRHTETCAASGAAAAAKLLGYPILYSEAAERAGVRKTSVYKALKWADSHIKVRLYLRDPGGLDWTATQSASRGASEPGSR